MSKDEKPPTTCCEMRRKAVVFLGPVLAEEVCGIPDSILADFMRFDIDAPVGPDGKRKPVIGFRFCPWCGKLYAANSETRLTAVIDVTMEGDDSSGEEWKKGQAAEDDEDATL